MKIGIIGPCEDEINPFIDCMVDTNIEKHAMLDFHIGRYKQIEVVSAFCGVCKVNAAIATQILIDRFNVTHIIVVGVAGAIAEHLNIFDTVISDEVAYHDIKDEILTEYHPWMKTIYFKADNKMLTEIIKSIKDKAYEKTISIGRIVTGESFITQNGREEIINKHSPLCVDMESASIAHVCYVNSIPFIAIRSMSDTSKESGNDVFEKYCKLAANKSINILKGYLDSITPYN